MKYIILFFFCTALALFGCGYFLEVAYANKLTGFGVLTLFFIVIPLFSWHRWKNKNIKEYMLTQENLDKMRKREQLGRKTK